MTGQREHLFIARMREMLGLIATLLVVALIAGTMAFGGVAGSAIELARAVFYVAIVLFLISAVISLARGHTRIRRKHPVDAPR